MGFHQILSTWWYLLFGSRVALLRNLAHSNYKAINNIAKILCPLPISSLMVKSWHRDRTYVTIAVQYCIFAYIGHMSVISINYKLVGGHLVVLTPPGPNLSPKSSCASTTGWFPEIINDPLLYYNKTCIKQNCQNSADLSIGRTMGNWC